MSAVIFVLKTVSDNTEALFASAICMYHYMVLLFSLSHSPSTVYADDRGFVGLVLESFKLSFPPVRKVTVGSG